MHNQLESFLGLSGVLTGCGRIQLLGTAMTKQYFATLEAALPPGVLDQLLGAYQQSAQAGDRESAVESAILNDPKLGPVARALILLWYCGNWGGLPDAWHSAYGTAATEKVGVVSAEAFRAGLQWLIIGAHAPGTAQQGFASWSVLPGEIRI